MKIGRYTWQKGTIVRNSDLVKYFHTCVDGVLKKPMWYKQVYNTKLIKVTIEIEEEGEHEQFK